MVAMTLLLQLGQPWRDYISFGPGFMALIFIMIFLIKMAPTWKQVKLRELDLRSSEVSVRGEEAKALTMLSEVLRDVAVEQRKATDEQRRTTETIDILQRVNSDASDRLTNNVSALNERLDRIEKLTSLITQQDNLLSRVNVLESASHA